VTNLVNAVMLCNVCIRIKSKGKTMNLFFSFEKYLYLKYIQKYLYLNTFTNEFNLTKRKLLVLKYISMYLTPYLMDMGKKQVCLLACLDVPITMKSVLLALSLSLLFAIQLDISLRHSPSCVRDKSVSAVDKDFYTWVSSTYK